MSFFSENPRNATIRIPFHHNEYTYGWEELTTYADPQDFLSDFIDSYTGTKHSFSVTKLKDSPEWEAYNVSYMRGKLRGYVAFTLFVRMEKVLP